MLYILIILSIISINSTPDTTTNKHNQQTFNRSILFFLLFFQFYLLPPPIHLKITKNLNHLFQSQTRKNVYIERDIHYLSISHEFQSIPVLQILDVLMEILKHETNIIDLKHQLHD
jgi:hypothetical protein